MKGYAVIRNTGINVLHEEVVLDKVQSRRDQLKFMHVQVGMFVQILHRSR